MIKLTYKWNILLLSLMSFGVLLSGCSDSTTEDFLPNVSLSVTALNFRAIIGESDLQTVTIKNLSRENVTIERVTSTNEVFQIGGYFLDGQLVPLDTPFTIEGNGARAVWIGFYPMETEEYKGKTVVESIDINSNRETDLVDLSGFGLPIAE